MAGELIADENETSDEKTVDVCTKYDLVGVVVHSGQASGRAGVQVVQVCCYGYMVEEQVSTWYKCVVMVTWLSSRCPSGTSVLSWLHGWGAGVQMVQVCYHGYRVVEQVSTSYKCVVMVTGMGSRCPNGTSLTMKRSVSARWTMMRR